MIRFKITAALFLIATISSLGQIKTGSNISNTIANENPFLDVSEYSDGFANNIGKGLVFPRTDLTTWTFKTDNLDGISFPTAFDGMIVYNTGSGSTVSGQGQQVSVTPGFYYFSNPGATDNIANGQWLKMSGSGGGKFVDGATNPNDAVYTDGGVVIGKDEFTPPNYANPLPATTVEIFGDQKNAGITLRSSGDFFPGILMARSESTTKVNREWTIGVNSFGVLEFNDRGTYDSPDVRPMFSLTPVENYVGVGLNNPVAKLHVLTGSSFSGGTLDTDILRCDFNLTNTRFVVKGDGKVGIGTLNPSYGFDVVLGDAMFRNNLRLGNEPNRGLVVNSNVSPTVSVGGSGFASVFKTNGDNSYAHHIGFEVAANDANDGFFVSTDSNLDGVVDNVALKINANGNTGVGKTNPTSKLDVNGYVKLGSTDVTGNATPQPGMIRYNATTDKFQGYVNNAGSGTPGWVDLN